MGLGKTVEAIVLDKEKRQRYQKAFEEKGKAMTLIISPMSVMGSWKRHLATWQPELKVYAIDPKNRGAFTYAAQKGKADVFLCHWDSLRLMPELKKILWFHIIGDECVPLDTEILTKEGWKTYDRLTIGEQVMGYENGGLTWTTLLAVNLPGKRSVGTLSTKGFSATTTAAHEWLMQNKYGKPYDYRKITSSEHKPRGNHQQIILAAPYVGGNLNIAPNEAAIVAWILGDGSIYPTQTTVKGHPTSYSAFIFQTKPDMVEVIDQLLKLESVEHTKTLINRNDEPGGFGSTKPRYKWRISIMWVRNLFERAGLDYRDKTLHLDKFVLGLSSKARKAFCTAIEQAEGNNTSWAYTKTSGEKSTSPRDICQNPGPIKDAFRLAFTLEGYFTSLRNTHDKFGITRPNKQADYFKWQPNVRETEVWCPTTTTGNWLMRQGDLVCVTGNCHRIKNRKAQVTIALKSLHTNHKLGMSGTAADNKPGDLWSVLNWLYPRKWSSEKRFFDKHVLWRLHTTGGDCQAMNKETGDVCGKYHKTTFKEILGVAEVEELLAEMKPFYVRRLKEEVLDDLPEKYYTEIPIELGPQQRRAYDEMRRNMLAWVGEHETEPVAAPVIVAQLMRLQQFSLGYAELVDAKVRNADGELIVVQKVRMTEPSAKLDTLMEIIGDNPNEQIGVFSQFKQSINMLARRLDAAGISCCVLTGDTKEKDRDRIVEEFQRGDRRIFAGTIGAGGEGITLTAASTGVFLDRAWNPSKNKQAEDRFHRIGQKNAVQIIDLVARDTIDAQRNAKIQLKWSWLREILGDTVRR